MKMEIKDINPVTQLPALREVIAWFEEMFVPAHMLDVADWDALVEQYGMIMDKLVEKSNTIFYCEGNSVVRIGDMNGRGNVRIQDANLNMKMLAKEILDIGSKSGRLEVMEW